MAELKAKDIMTEDVITINKNASIEELSSILLENKISGVPVMDDDSNLVGVVTEADIIEQDTKLHFPAYFKLFDGIIYLESLNKFKRSLKKHLATRIEDIMTKKLKTISPDTSVSEIADIMLKQKINRLPILDEDGKLIGIVTRADIVKSTVT